MNQKEFNLRMSEAIERDYSKKEAYRTIRENEIEKLKMQLFERYEKFEFVDIFQCR